MCTYDWLLKNYQYNTSQDRHFCFWNSDVILLDLAILCFYFTVFVLLNDESFFSTNKYEIPINDYIRDSRGFIRTGILAL